jgi:hypothetical protein
MVPNSPTADAFILSVFDHGQWYPVLKTRFRAHDLETLSWILESTRMTILSFGASIFSMMTSCPL